MRTASILTLALLLGCQTTPRPNNAASPDPASQWKASEGESTRSPSSGSAGSTGELVALWRGRSIQWAALRPALVEAAGGQVLAEWLLTQQVEAALDQEGLRVSEDDIAREKALMLRRLADDPDQAARLLQRLRQRRGLGPTRFDMLLRRNAGLRKLVADEAEATDSMVRRAYERQYGRKTVARMILVPTLNDAGQVIQRLEEGEPFIDLAVDLSRDASRAQGGLLPPISPADATFPKVVRETVAGLEPGQVADPVALQGGFAILKAERKIDAQQVPFEEAAPELREQVRLRVEQNLMQRRARTMLQNADPTILNARLNQAWQTQRGDLLETP